MEVDSMRVPGADAAAGCVVRQFVPSRIERQVLVQVFELVLGGEGASGEVRSASSGPALAGPIAPSERRTEATVLERRVA